VHESGEDELIRSDNEVRRPSRVKTRDIRPRVTKMSTDYESEINEEGNAKDVKFKFFEK
jgi:hypothetical protein